MLERLRGTFELPQMSQGMTEADQGRLVIRIQREGAFEHGTCLGDLRQVQVIIAAFNDCNDVGRVALCRPQECGE